eukprot:GHVU01107849.1.p2 GENE.GHVU01107849.1~~GHVU01107849.1.p2  ORF type:complete len:109 (+),score=1.87 GHVU01107849.1:872-1198(+)
MVLRQMLYICVRVCVRVGLPLLDMSQARGLSTAFTKKLPSRHVVDEVSVGPEGGSRHSMAAIDAALRSPRLRLRGNTAESGTNYTRSFGPRHMRTAQALPTSCGRTRV